MRVGVAQVAPVFLRRDPTLGKVTDFIAGAAGAGCRLVVFGESPVPGYPVWLGFTDGARFDSDYQKQLYSIYLDQAVRIDDGHRPDVLRLVVDRRRQSIASVLATDGDLD
jgi:nitrilase